jgi:hypothetical protein
MADRRSIRARCHGAFGLSDEQRRFVRDRQDFVHEVVGRTSSVDANGQRLFGAQRYAGHATSAARAGQLRDPPVAERGDG